MTINILLLEDNSRDAEQIKQVLKHSGLKCHIILADTKEKFEDALSQPIDIFLVKYLIPNFHAMTALQIARSRNISAPFILMTETIDEESIIEMFQMGISDLVYKNQINRLIPRLKRALSEKDEQQKRMKAEDSLQTATKALSEHALLFFEFTENISEVFWKTSPDSKKIEFVSPAYEKIWGKKVEDLYRNPQEWYNSVLEEDKHLAEEFFNLINANQESINVIYRIKRTDGEIRTILDRGRMLKTDNRNLGIVGIATDITERAKIQEQLFNSLEEKKTLLKEIYHRVKNNLQIVSSLLNLQADAIQDPEVKKIFLENSSRVRSMSLAHEMLYQTNDLSFISMKTYLENLIRNLTDIYHSQMKRVEIVTDIDPVNLSLNEAIPCGLMINELVSNSLIHGFPGKRSGQINIKIKNTNNLINLSVSDDGVGISPQLDFQMMTTLGIKLILILTKQLDGSLELDRSHGTRINIQFRLKEQHP
jgi:PAS domain S-box-containing protein